MEGAITKFKFKAANAQPKTSVAQLTNFTSMPHLQAVVRICHFANQF